MDFKKEGWVGNDILCAQNTKKKGTVYLTDICFSIRAQADFLNQANVTCVCPQNAEQRGK
jgi:hypothetical protein